MGAVLFTDPAAVPPIFTGLFKDICAPGQTIMAQVICSGIPADRRLQYLQPGVGHYGIFNGRRWRSDILPRISGFIAAS
jgi:poly(3-hydroxybutyrate) depolymerase